MHLNDKKKLKITKYNKRTQKLLHINILDYKIFGGKYIILDNGKGR